jgi:hypothetical protein
MTTDFYVLIKKENYSYFIINKSYKVQLFSELQITIGIIMI